MGSKYITWYKDLVQTLFVIPIQYLNLIDSDLKLIGINTGKLQLNEEALLQQNMGMRLTQNFLALKDVHFSRINSRVMPLIMMQLNSYGIISRINFELACNSLPIVQINYKDGTFEFIHIGYQDEMN